MAKQRKHNRMFSIKKALLYSSVILIFLIGIGVGYAVYLFDRTSDTITESHEELGREDDRSSLRDDMVDPVEDNVSILFMGVDSSEHRGNDDHSLSDALLLATFNKEDSNVKLLSIPRDSYVRVPELGYHTKINHAHAFGGPSATIETVEEFLELPVDYFVRMNFEGFIEVVDSLDGIPFDVPYEFTESDSNDNRDAIHLYPGEQMLNGEEALALARTRDNDNDIERGKRQQEIMESIAKKATSASSVLKLDELITAVGSNMATNLNFSEIRSFFSYGLDEQFAIETVNLEGTGGYMEDGVWYYQVDEASRVQIQDELREHLNLPSINGVNDFAEDEVSYY
ncbi:LCP family protein required for cell wall assembly [Virgibacillus natechei]|uniref:LCP family protein required for cell wall assembly n=1 Tax=Virgibacillus natechei TaxID=1216297 RepID=A0ABS4IEL6_9BACI|nr:LCP family protein [Virgibacillus natechei]MBP1969377.1 LCP family protein required for cell wall assembly [Virgibacillus natechei]UZD12521.1 LCP family protein [Virgibacillus natechei]